MILLWNIRTIQAISRVLGDEIAEITQRRTAETPSDKSNPAPQAETSSKFTPAFSRVLPLLRVYMAWLCFYGPGLVEFRAHFEPYFGAMCTTLSATLTLLYELLGTDSHLGNTVSWRFPEDEMTLGVKCLNGPDLHDGCQLYYDAFTRLPKPRREDVPETDCTPDDITFTRALDIILCAYDLSAPESKFPLVTSTTTNGTTFEYLEGGKPDPALSIPAVQQPISNGSGTAAPMQANVPDTSEQIPEAAPSPCESNELSEDQEFYGPSLRRFSHGAHHVQAEQAVGAAQPMPVSEFPIENQLFKILNDFMAPPESATKAKPETPSRVPGRMSAYGMESLASTQGSSTSPMPGSAGTKAFPTLPWKYFYDPDSATRDPGAGATAPGWNVDGSGSPRPVSSGNTGQFRGAAPPGIPVARNGYDSEAGQMGPLEDEAGVLRALNLGSEFNDPVNPPLGGYGTRGSWSGVAGDANLPRQNPWSPSANPWQTTQGQCSTAGHAPNSPFSTLDFSGATSSLPPVNSPWGLTAARGYPSQGGLSMAAAGKSPASARSFGTWSHGRMPQSDTNESLPRGDT